MTFTSGTSEGNGDGLLINPGSKYNTFIGLDIEGNTSGSSGIDVTDNAGFNTFQNIIATSTSSLNFNLTGTGGQDWWIGVAGEIPFKIGGAGLYGFIPFDPFAGATIPTTASGFVGMYVRGQVVYIPYYFTLP